MVGLHQILAGNVITCLEPLLNCTGVGSGGARGAAALLNAGRRGLRPPTNLRLWVSEM